MLEHGGRLQHAAKKYGIPLENWLDLSTGINPNGWPVPQLPAIVWQRLPEDDDELVEAASRYYGNSSVLPVAGSQAAIQTLPFLRPRSRVGVFHPAYAEHEASWRKAGHQLIVVNDETVDEQVDSLDVLIVINPNNPTGKLWSREQLLGWHERLSIRGGWLIADEAFIDPIVGEFSLSPLPVRDGLIVLRSIGKFFGLAGIRCGFVIAEESLLNRLRERLGPWAISHPGRIVAAMALRDVEWQQVTTERLTRQGERLRQLLIDNGLPPAGGCSLFQWVRAEDSVVLHEQLAGRGISTRLFNDPVSLRFGLPGDEAAWQRLNMILGASI